MLQAGGQGEAYAPLDFGRPEGAAGQRQRAALLLISFDYSWFLAKNLSNFVSLPWKLHNRYCHPELVDPSLRN